MTKTIEKESTLKVKRSYSVHGEEVHRDDTDVAIEVHDFQTAPANIGVDLGVTLNMGNYEAVRLGVHVQVPCYLEEIEPAYEWAKDFAKSRLEAECKEARSFLNTKIQF